MVDRINAKIITVPKNTLQSAPTTTTFTIRPGVVDTIEILIPPGPSGLVGFQVLFAGVQMIPDDPGVFIVSDDEQIRWPLHGFGTDGRWSVRAFNTDVNDHKLFFRLLVNELPYIAPGPVTLVPITQE